MYKAAHNYVCVDVLSDCTYDWTPYYTLHIHMDAHPYIYHMNICIQHCVYEVVHSQYPGKTQRLNIRIHSDRKNKCFYSYVYIK
jgi:hypothetical protein